ncbi:anhydro-N-acetylmuramic acid kinase [Labrys wisconsinensis]|uniref:Anhydro-N-acetylmuramic acid kinase n=1 Tax=Labrys wisconsinensis TaxID=425677 RepID=A0ABU0J467_9HYPH|nr:anhydro-N-acetylmuramic acid kinase [Labrys wisconsinensis]MDQ0469024.1 anhydro-N-acetylmuramic acid kinase [Labrys wisconsinensis]
MALLTALGLMSGTSMDGIDLALIETDGAAAVRMGPSASLDYDDAERSLLRQALRDAAAMTDRAARPGVLAEAERRLTASHATLVRRFLAEQAIEPRQVAVIGFHGQTVLHRPAERLTVQIGDGAALAAATGIPVVSDLRAADVAAGGQGAPFVPAFHRALVEAGTLPGPVAVLNLGGVGNVTYVERGQDPIAFDTGPANALIDDLMLERTGRAVDADGRAALAGTVDAAALAALLDHEYFGKKPPKSLDRNEFSRSAVASLSTEDAAATLTAFTAGSVALARRWLPKEPALWVVCGGGARNPAILAALAARVPGAVTTADAVGWSAAMMEAQAFAYLAVRSLDGLPLSFPSTTGVPRPMTGGVLSRPEPAPGPTMVTA